MKNNTIFIIMLVSFLSCFNSIPASGQSLESLFSPLLLPQLSRPYDPISLAMGLSGVAYRKGLFAPVSNPAGLAELARPGVSFSHFPAYGSGDSRLYNQEAVIAGFKLSRNFAIGFQGTHLNLGTINEPSEGENASQFNRQVWLTLASKISFIEFGANMKLLYLQGVTSTTVGKMLDLGVKLNYKTKESRIRNYWASIGCVVQNIFHSFDTEDEEEISLPQILRLGFAAGKQLPCKLTSLAVTVEYQNAINYGPGYWRHLGSGVEMMLFDHLFIEFGYSFDLRKLDEYYEDFRYSGAGYGFGFKTPGPLSSKLPVNLMVSYGHGVGFAIPYFNPNVLSVQLQF